MDLKWPQTIPDRHRAFLISAIDRLKGDPRIVGIAAGGSFLSDTMDEFSDIDLVIAVEVNRFDAMMSDRHGIAASLGPLVADFTGEHVGEPRLLICLYDGRPVLHVDLKFVSLPHAAKRVEDPCILWERDGRLTKALAEGSAQYPIPEHQWIEDRFWVWVHYTASKIGRGELFEALDCLAFIRTIVLGPLIHFQSETRPCGVRRIEQLAPDHSRALKATVARYDALDCLRALQVSVDMYRALRCSSDTLNYNHAAEDAARHYVIEIEERCARIDNAPEEFHHTKIPVKRQDHEPPAALASKGWRYHHLGIPTANPQPDERYLPHLKMYVSGFDTSPYGIEWMRFEPDCPISELVRTVPHIAFEVDDLDAAIVGLPLSGEISSPSEGVRVAMFVDNGTPIELIEFRKP